MGPGPQRQPWHIGGSEEFQQTGWSAAAGQPYAEWGHMLAIDNLGYNIEAHVAGAPIEFPQSGQVWVYNISSDVPWKRSWFSGDRMFGRFGGKLKVRKILPCLTLFAQYFYILANRITRISDILSWDRKSYLTHAILTRLSREGCTLVVLELTHMVIK